MKPIELEFRKGSSAKFWRVAVKGSRQVVRYGRVGTEGRELEKSFASPAQAKAAAQKLAETKRKKGYVDAESSSSNSPRTLKAAKKSPKKSRVQKAGTHKGRVSARVDEITQWLTEHPPDAFPEEVEFWSKMKPASDAAIRKAEKSLGLTLPADFKAYLGIHNGTSDLAQVVWGGLHQIQDIPRLTAGLHEMLGDERVEQPHHCDARIKPLEFSPSWIAISTSARNRDHLCLDLDPDKGGTKGQVILVSVDSGGAHDWLAESFEDFLDYYLRGYLQKKRKPPKKKARPKTKKRTAKKKSTKKTAAQRTPAKVRSPKPTARPAPEAYLPLPRNARLEKRLCQWERTHAKAWGTWLKKQGHPLAEVVFADLKAEAEPRQKKTEKKHALEVFQRYVDGYYRPRYRGLADHISHFTQEGADYFGFRYGILDNLHNFELQSKSQIRQLLEFLKDPHAIFARRIILRKFTITDLEFLSEFRAVRELKLDWSNLKKLRSIDPVADMKHLRSISVEGSAVRGVRPLAKLPVIQVCLDSTPITAIEPLGGHKTLQHIMLSDTAIRNVTPLEWCKNLCSANLYCTFVTDQDAEGLDKSIRRNRARPSRDEYLMHGFDKDGVFHEKASSKKDKARLRGRTRL
ncbi:MAG: SMI1/KNR4 family protein [Myxococcota bacterium]